MPEAWTEKWQPLVDSEDAEDDRVVGAGTILESAARLGVGVFGSAPLKVNWLAV